MKAIYIDNFESGSVTLREVDDSRNPSANEVTVKIHASGLNRGDLLQARGKYPPPQGFSPHKPGLELAGEIISLGENVTDFSIGDRVMGLAAGEAQAELITAHSGHIVKIPDNLTFIQAAAIPEAFITAHDALFTQAQLKRGDTLLIHAVASGVGLAALQLANAVGVEVIGTSRTESKLERCSKYGLKLFVEPSELESFSTSVKKVLPGGVDVVLDLVGGKYFIENIKSLDLKGRMILVGLTSGTWSEIDLGMMLHKRLNLKGTVLRSRTDDEKSMAVAAFKKDVQDKFKSGDLVPIVDRVYSASDVADAYAFLASDQSFGKVVLQFIND